MLDSKEIAEMINILLLVSKESSGSTQTKAISYEQVYKELYERSLTRKLATATTATADSFTSNEPFNFTQEDFMMWSVQSHLNLLQPFLDLLFEVCHVVLGLRPQCRHLEYNIGNTSATIFFLPYILITLRCFFFLLFPRFFSKRMVSTGSKPRL